MDVSRDAARQGSGFGLAFAIFLFSSLIEQNSVNPFNQAYRYENSCKKSSRIHKLGPAVQSLGGAHRFDFRCQGT
jgi:hypothetical protein